MVPRSPRLAKAPLSRAATETRESPGVFPLHLGGTGSKGVQYERQRTFLNSRGVTLARSGNIQRLWPNLIQPPADFDWPTTFQLHAQVRLLPSVGDAAGQQCAPLEAPFVEYQRRVTVDDVLLGAWRILRGFHFDQVITTGNRPVLGQPTLGAPSAVLDLVRDRSL